MKVTMEEQKLKDDDDDDIEDVLESILKKLCQVVHLLKKLIGLVDKMGLGLLLLAALALLWLYYRSTKAKKGSELKIEALPQSSSSGADHEGSRSWFSKLKVHLDLRP